MESEHNIEIVNLSIEDREQWQALCIAYGEGGGGDDYAWDDNKADIVWSWLNDPAHPLECLVAKSSTGELVGYIADLFTHSDHRRKGIATRLIEHVAKIGRQRGWRSLRWLTYTDNEEAQKLYDRIAKRKDRIVYQLVL